ncbi:hypothetical protein ACFQ60_32180 [Streptomyces zhihengii]
MRALLVRNGCARVGVAADFADVTAEAAEAEADGCPVRVDRLGADDGWTALADWDVVVVTGAGAAARTHRLLAAGVPEGRTLIPAWTFGEHRVTGPLSTAATAGCWSCAALRLGAGPDAGAAAADLWAEVAGVLPDAASPLTGPVAAMSGNLLGYEVFRVTTGALPAETDGQVLLQDLRSLDVVAEPVHPTRAASAAPAVPRPGPTARRRPRSPCPRHRPWTPPARRRPWSRTSTGSAPPSSARTPVSSPATPTRRSPRPR